MSNGKQKGGNPAKTNKQRSNLAANEPTKQIGKQAKTQALTGSAPGSPIASEPKVHHLRSLIAIILGVATLIGIIPVVVIFWPRMTVIPSGLFDDSNAYSEIFTITNTGFLPFENVSSTIGLCSIQTEKHDFAVTPNNCDETGPHLLLGLPKWETPELRRDESLAIVLADVLNTATDEWRANHPTVITGFQTMPGLSAANIIVSVVFQPWPFTKTLRYKYRFVAEKQSNGKMMWRAIPLSWVNVKLPDE
jgi:hypothetical protein